MVHWESDDRAARKTIRDLVAQVEEFDSPSAVTGTCSHAISATAIGSCSSATVRGGRHTGSEKGLGVFSEEEFTAEWGQGTIFLDLRTMRCDFNSKLTR